LIALKVSLPDPCSVKLSSFARIAAIKRRLVPDDALSFIANPSVSFQVASSPLDSLLSTAMQKSGLGALTLFSEA
jgi:hypothetical protein